MAIDTDGFQLLTTKVAAAGIMQKLFILFPHTWLITETCQIYLFGILLPPV
jgi:hypothetical protein